MVNELTNTPLERAAVVGVGYVGMTLLCALGRAGFRTVGYDINTERVDSIARGQVPFTGAEPALVQLLDKLVAEGTVTATTDPAAIETAQAVFIAVETPVDDADHRPRYAALRAALQSIGPHLAPGALVVVESTIAPGTIDRLVLPALQAATGGQVGKDFYLVHCPERVMPGKLLQNISTCDRIVGGVTPACTERGLQVYARVTSGTLHPTNALAAEITKTAENAYRDVQIAFANELALMCEELGADVYEVRELVNSSPFRQMHIPGAGVGGHCIPKDPWLLCSAMEHYAPRLLPIARNINDGMPAHLVALLAEELREAGQEMAGARIAILGAAYMEGTDDIRNAPALALARLLVEQGAIVRLVDPFVDQLEEFIVQRQVEGSLYGVDAALLVTAHQAFKGIDLAEGARQMRTPILIDGRNAFTGEAAETAGLRYRGIGKGVREAAQQNRLAA